MKTLLFCTAFVPAQDVWEQRYLRWLRHHQSSRLCADGIVLIDDGSTFVPSDLPVVLAEDLGRLPLEKPTLVRFPVNLGRSSLRIFPGWTRSFGFALTIAEKYGFEKIVHVESDAYVLSERLVDYINALTSGWTAFWVPSQGFPESALQVICADSFAAFAVVRDLGPYGNKDLAPELALPFTLVNKDFVGDRYGEIDVPIPAKADYAVQVLPSMATQNLMPRTASSPIQRDASASALSGAVRPSRSVVLAKAQDVDRADQLRDAGEYTKVERLLLELQREAPLDMTVVTRLGVLAYVQQDITTARAWLERSVAIEPGDPLAQKFLAAARMDDHELAGAIGAIQEAIRLDPVDPNVRNMAGAFFAHAGRFVEAVMQFAGALELDPNDGSSLSNLASMPWDDVAVRAQYPEGMLGFEARARALLLQCLKEGRLTDSGASALLGLRASTGPEFTAILGLAHDVLASRTLDAALAFSLGKIFTMGGSAEAALLAYQRAAELAPSSFQIRNALGYQKIFAGGSQWSEGFTMANETWPQINPAAYVASVPSWRGEDLHGKELLVYQEQGVGDAIMALRFIPLLAARGIHAVVWTLPSLHNLAASVGGARFIASAAAPDPASLGLGHAVPLLGLIDALHLDAADVKANPTHLVAAAQQVARFSDRLGPPKGLRVGLCLLGNPKRSDDWLRSVPPDQWTALSALSGIEWVNLSVDERGERARLHSSFRGLVDLIDQDGTFDDTAALIANLDVVVSIDSVVAHIAAGLGKPTLLLLPTINDWRWQSGSDLKPWWPTSETFRASAPQDFRSAVSAIAGRLQSLTPR